MKEIKLNNNNYADLICMGIMERKIKMLKMLIIY